MTMHTTQSTRATRARKAFSLIELLVVIAVIGIVIGIIVPTLGGARNTAKAASTKAQLNEIGNASQQYYNDQQRWPGYFTAKQMGVTENGTRGFSGMQNVMLDLAGGIVPSAGTGTNFVAVGPISGEEVIVDLTLIGTREGGGGYYTPDDNRFVAQLGSGVGFQQAETDNQTLPSVVDSFGTPILAWQRDRTAIQPIEALDDFAQVASGGTKSARFYWNSNTGFLKTEELGKRGKNPTFGGATGGREYSLLGDTEPDITEHMAVLLGAPTVPNTMPGAEAYPTAARGDLIFHSGGIDAMYMGSKDKGGRGTVRFWQSFYTDASGSTRLADRDGKVETIDVLSNFDDMIQTAGN
ncbi:MAG: type II secretion system protein [Phycisphaerales bacterium JB064]